tara:strand:+ start:41 stop:400 length:360 start_codon:yes stop_codon:yes gene_type:complete
MEAVNRYMLATDIDLIEQQRATNSNVHEMTPNQKVAVGLSALQTANRDGETIGKHVMDNLRAELPFSVTEIEKIDPKALTYYFVNRHEPWICPYCDKECSSLQGMRKHMLKMHDIDRRR